ncbi:MAG: hypothetical protein ABWU16_04100 [Halothiobacillaceae bacterium]
MSMPRLHILFAALALGWGWLAVGPALAAEVEDARPWYDRVQAGMSSWLIGTAAGLDSFFGDPRAIEEDYTETYARLQLGITKSRLQDIEWSSRVYAKVALPRLSRRLNIFVVGGEEDQGMAAEPEESLRKTEESSTVGVQYVLDETDRGRWSLSGSLSPNVKLRYRYLYPLGAGWYARYTQNLYWDKDKDTGIQWRGDLERVIADNTLFRLTLDADYWGDKTGVNWVAGGALLHRLDGRSALALDASASGVSEPTLEIAQYRMGLRYRRNFFRSWLFYELEPALRWTQDPLHPADRMIFDPAISVRLEIQFGKVTGL